MSIIAIIAGLMVLIIVHEFGHWAVAQWRGMQTPVFCIGFGKPYIVLGHWRGTEFRLTPWLAGGYVSLPEMADETTVKEFMSESGQNPADFKYFKVWERTVVAVAGVTMNFLVAIVLSFALFACVGTPYFEPGNTYVAQLSPANKIARDAGIQLGDIVLAVDGKEVRNAEDLIKLLSPHRETPATLLIQRGTKNLSLVVTPNKDGKIGIAIGQHLKRHYEKIGVGTAAVKSITFNANALWNMLKGIGMIMHVVAVPPGMPAEAGDVHGVVAIVQIGTMAYNNGPYDFINLLGLLSLSLAILNILPIPVLDGGYLIFFAIEAIRGKPIDRVLQQKILSVFTVLLVMLMLYGLFNDFFKPIDLHF